MSNTKHTNFKIYKNTDTVDVADKCLGLSVDRKSIPRDVMDYIKTNRGLHIQIRHNGDAQAGAQANLLSNLIAAAPDLLDALEESLSCIDQWTDDDVVGPIIRQAQKAIAKAKGELK